MESFQQPFSSEHDADPEIPQEVPSYENMSELEIEVALESTRRNLGYAHRMLGGLLVSYEQHRRDGGDAILRRRHNTEADIEHLKAQEKDLEKRLQIERMKKSTGKIAA